MKLKESDYLHLLKDESVDVMGELIKMNLSQYYHNTLDVIRLSREINLKRIQLFMKN